MKKIYFAIILTFLSINLFANTNITVTSGLLSCCVKDIGKEKVSVSTLVPVSACPGHFDLSVNDIKKAKKADFIFYHGFEPYPKKIGNKNTFTVCKDQNMLIPKHYIEGLNFICEKLSQKDPKNSPYYKKNLKSATERVSLLDKTVKSKIKPLKNKKAVCSVNCKPLLIYFGYDVVASFPIPDKITPGTWKNIIQKTKNMKIDCCVDNLQSGKNTSLQLSRDIKAKHFATSNFPGGFDNTETYDKCLLKNLEICLQK